jgi:novel protein kinase C epsilon type
MNNSVKEIARKRPDNLGRQGAVRKRKGEIHEQNGHKFIQQIFYQVMKCAYCEELFVNEGYQCDGMRYNSKISLSFFIMKIHIFTLLLYFRL